MQLCGHKGGQVQSVQELPQQAKNGAKDRVTASFHVTLVFGGGLEAMLPEKGT